MKSIVRGALLSSLLAVVCGTASAQWVWMDKNGNKVYSDRAPSIDVPERDILKRPAAAKTSTTLETMPPLPSGAPAGSASAPAAPASASLPASAPQGSEKQNELEKAVEAKKKQAKEAELAKKRADDERMWKAKIENCARAKQAYATYSSNAPIARMNADGGREFIDPQTRAAELQRAQAIMAQDCQ